MNATRTVVLKTWFLFIHLLFNSLSHLTKDAILKTSILNTLIIIAALAATSGFAQAAPSSQYHDAGYKTVSNTTRAAVKVEVLKARADVTLVQLGGEDTFANAPAVLTGSPLGKIRARFKSQLRMAVFMHPVGEVWSQQCVAMAGSEKKEQWNRKKL
jgi:hypothetical protein